MSGIKWRPLAEENHDPLKCGMEAHIIWLDVSHQISAQFYRYLRLDFQKYLLMLLYQQIKLY